MRCSQERAVWRPEKEPGQHACPANSKKQSATTTAPARDAWILDQTCALMAARRPGATHLSAWNQDKTCSRTATKRLRAIHLLCQCRRAEWMLRSQQGEPSHPVSSVKAHFIHRAFRPPDMQWTSLKIRQVGTFNQEQLIGTNGQPHFHDW